MCAGWTMFSKIEGSSDGGVGSTLRNHEPTSVAPSGRRDTVEALAGAAKSPEINRKNAGRSSHAACMVRVGLPMPGGDSLLRPIPPVIGHVQQPCRSVQAQRTDERG